jgi:hypothetical protein
MARLSGRAAALLGCSLILRDRLRERLGSGADGKHRVRILCGNTGGCGTERFASPRGQLPNAEVDP